MWVRYFNDDCGGFSSFCKIWSTLSIIKVDQGVNFEAPEWHYWHLSKFQTCHIKWAAWKLQSFNAWCPLKGHT